MRALSLINPKEGSYFSNLDQFNALGTENYRGLKLTFRRRGNLLTLNGNYTLSRCFGTATPGSFPQLSTGFTKPNDPNFDRGHCVQDRTHIVNFTMGYETPTLKGAVELNLPPNSNSGRTLRLRGKGLPAADGQPAGDLLVTLRIVLPDEPDPELEALMKRWRINRAYKPRDGMR